MQSTVEATTGLERRISVQVPSDEVEKRIEDRLRSMGPQVRIKGFRPGKVPAKVVRQRFGQQVRDEVVGELVQSSFADAISEQKIQPAGAPRIETHSFEPGQDLAYTALVEVLPEITLNDFDGEQIERPKVAITDADVDSMLERLRHQHADWEEVERAAQSGDRVVINFVGTIDGEEFEGGRAEDFSVEIGRGQLLESFESGLVGVQPGEATSIELTFPENYQAEDLAGKAAVFEVQVKTVSASRLPEVDDAFAQTLGVSDGGVDKLREQLKESIEREAEQNIKNRVKEAVLDRLCEKNPIELPNVLVDSEIGQLQKEMAGQLGMSGDTPPDLPRELFEERARKRVALGLLVAELVKENEFTVDPKRVNETIDTIVGGHEHAEMLAQAYRNSPEAMRSVQSMVMEEQVVDWLLDRAEVMDVDMTFEQLIGGGSSAGEGEEEAES
ncbi:MAG: trigger factor [Pseudomonadota bacterium]|nr:trigger factor [Pseudomonadota bacterium]